MLFPINACGGFWYCVSLTLFASDSAFLLAKSDCAVAAGRQRFYMKREKWREEESPAKST